MTDGPHLEACVECWAPAVGGVPSCDHDAGVHRWAVRRAMLCVSHPAVPRPLVGYVALPTTSARMLRLMVRHRRVLRQAFAVDPRAPRTTWWTDLDPTPDYEALGLPAPS